MTQEGDYKSPSSALYQGFVLEQSLLEVNYNDNTQCFDMECPVTVGTAVDNSAMGQDIDNIYWEIRLDFEDSQSWDPGNKVLFEIFVQQEAFVVATFEIYTPLVDLTSTLLPILQDLGATDGFRIQRLHQAFPPNPLVKKESLVVIHEDDKRPTVTSVMQLPFEDRKIWMTKIDSDCPISSVLKKNPWQVERESGAWKVWMFKKQQSLDATIPLQCGILLEFAVNTDCVPISSRADEIEEIEDNPFEVPWRDQPGDLMQLDPIEQDPPFVDQRLWESEAFRLLVEERQSTRVRLVFFGYDGDTTERGKRRLMN